VSHVRSADTSTSVMNSRNELERILARYGCTRSGSDTDREAQRVTVWFTVPDHKLGKGEFVPVRIEVSLRDVRARLEAHEKAARRQVRYTAIEQEQVERVAWRHIVFLVEAGLVAAEAGIKKVSEFFLADTVMRDSQGREARLIDLLDKTQPEWKALLGSGGKE
jgi:hypothetical protein